MSKRPLIFTAAAIVIVAVIVIVNASSDTRVAQATLSNAISNQYELNSVSYLGELKINNIEDGKSKLASAEIRGDAVNLKDPENSRMQFNINVIDSGALGLGQEAVLKTSLKIIGKTLYFRLDNFNSDKLAIDFSTISQKWIKLENLEEQAANLGANSAVGLNSLIPILGDEELSHMQSIVAQSNVLKVTQDFGIDNGAYHFAYEVDLGAALELVESINEIAGQEIDEQEIRAAKEELIKFKKSIKPKGEIWIDSDTEYIKRITLDLKLPGTNEAPGEIAATFDIQMLNFNNNDVEIEEPEAAINFEEAFTIVMQSIFSLDPR
ncbi:MAG: hypothetical protein Q8Q32_03545 [bacterium]|nr:hypothetical protein [bacterium]